MPRRRAMEEALQLLGYSGSTNFIRSESEDLISAVDHVHLLRKATAECGLLGIYALRPEKDSAKGIIPVVYVCEADDEAAANAIHKRVWNQNVAPFLLVLTRRSARLYAGFQYAEGDPERGVLEAAVAFNQIADRLAPIQAEAIDTGKVWESYGKFVTPNTRVDRRLLEHLRVLDGVLQREGLDLPTSHALIGKFVYLRYLRDRDILSDYWLRDWKISAESLFTREATLTSFWAVNERLDEWLNGAVFPLAARKRDIRSEHLKRVAGVFFGDAPEGQLHLDFRAYDFSFLPTELLSSIYEQFLHTPGPGEDTSRGKRAGAYYTPVPLINFVLSELEDRKPLKEGMKILDPACGSGAFLVQCYRRLIEARRTETGSSKLRPVELRELLQKHIFGVESDPDACQVTELSLILTLLDNVDPPDLRSNRNFKLPCLQKTNIFEADFFDPRSKFEEACGDFAFDWLIGNPPWKEVSRGNIPSEDQNVWEWIKDNRNEYPVGGHQVAEAFAWKATQHVAAQGVIGLVLPAMTLFKSESKPFRQKLFSEMSVWCLANFANLAYVLFAGRAERSAAVFFYSPGNPKADDTILTYAPFVINQEANRPSGTGKHQATWSIVVNSDELVDVSVREVASGSMLPWKLAMWGSHRGQKLLERVTCRFPPLQEFFQKTGLSMHRGVEFRSVHVPGQTQHVPELIGKLRLIMDEVPRGRRLFAFPAHSLQRVGQHEAYVTKRGGTAGLEAAVPPHLIMNRGLKFAVYSDQYVAFPKSQIGITGTATTRQLLKALVLLFNSDFARFHCFFRSPEWGINTSISTIGAIRSMPAVLAQLTPSDLREWERVHDEIAAAPKKGEEDVLRGQGADRGHLAVLVDRINALVFDALGLHLSERRVVTDFVRERLELRKGRAPSRAVKRPADDEIRGYLGVLKQALDGFIGPGAKAHRVTAFPTEAMAAVQIEVVNQEDAREPRVSSISTDGANELARICSRLRREHSQWLYFNRNLKVYDGTRTYLFKPMHRVHWTATQGILDADEVIAETLMST